MPLSSPVDPRESMKAQLAYTLRAQRTLRGLSQDQLAKELYATRETIAAYETGRNRPDVEFCKKLDEFFGAGEMFQSLWHHAQREHLREWFEQYVGHENEVAEIRTFQPLYIPGLLQTEGYIRATWLSGTVIEEKGRAAADPAGHPHPGGRSAASIRSHRPGGDSSACRRAAVMKEQLRHLLAMSELPNVSIQVVELSGGWYFGLSGAIVVLTKPDARRVGYVEANFGGRLIEDPCEVVRLGLRFDQSGAGCCLKQTPAP